MDKADKKTMDLVCIRVITTLIVCAKIVKNGPPVNNENSVADAKKLAEEIVRATPVE